MFQANICGERMWMSKQTLFSVSALGLVPAILAVALWFAGFSIPFIMLGIALELVGFFHGMFVLLILLKQK